MSLTTDPKDECLKDGQKQEGQNECYLVLSEEERAKGFIRPVRTKYVHKGRKYDGLTKLDKPEKHNDKTYVAIASIIVNAKYLGGTYLTQEEMEQHESTNGYVGGCGAVTKMGEAIAETYARDPKFYGSTFCVGCNKHLPVSEFVWDGTDEKVGS